MTSHRRRSLKMKHSKTNEKKRTSPRGRKKLDFDNVQKHHLPLYRKSIYMDIKNTKQAEIIEEQLQKLGAKIETFLSSEVNYVISTFGPTKTDDRSFNSCENPQSPSFGNVPSPFSCGPSPTGHTESKKTVVSRGKALAQIACSKTQASTVVANAEKLGIKVVSVDVANKWLERELKKIEKECQIEVDKKENKSSKVKENKKESKKKSKVLKGSFIKFEATNLHYKPIKSELPKWPRLNLLAPPGICPFGEGKLRVQQKYGPRKCLPQQNSGVAEGGVAVEVKEETVVKPVIGDMGGAQPLSTVQELVGVPVLVTGDIKRNLNFQGKKNTNMNKQQGYCDCCEMKYKDFDQHVTGKDHIAFSRDKSNYESLDSLITEIPSTIKFLQSVLLKHCVKKQTEPADNSQSNEENLLNIAPPISPLTTEKTGLPSQEVAPLSLNTPQPAPCDITPSKDELTVTDAELISKQEIPTLGEEADNDDRPQAVVIRRPIPSGLFTSPRRKQPTPRKKPWVKERSMVFRDSPIGSLQPSPCSSSLVGDSSIVGSDMSRCFPQREQEPHESKPVFGSLRRAIDFHTKNTGDGNDDSVDLPKEQSKGRKTPVKTDKPYEKTIPTFDRLHDKNVPEDEKLDKSLVAKGSTKKSQGLRIKEANLTVNEKRSRLVLAVKNIVRDGNEGLLLSGEESPTKEVEEEGLSINEKGALVKQSGSGCLLTQVQYEKKNGDDKTKIILGPENVEKTNAKDANNEIYGPDDVVVPCIADRVKQRCRNVSEKKDEISPQDNDESENLGESVLQNKTDSFVKQPARTEYNATEAEGKETLTKEITVSGESRKAEFLDVDLLSDKANELDVKSGEGIRRKKNVCVGKAGADYGKGDSQEGKDVTATVNPLASFLNEVEEKITLTPPSRRRKKRQSGREKQLNDMQGDDSRCEEERQSKTQPSAVTDHCKDSQHPEQPPLEENSRSLSPNSYHNKSSERPRQGIQNKAKRGIEETRPNSKLDSVKTSEANRNEGNPPVNIAKTVKRKSRHCNEFKHEGLYANNGEGIDCVLKDSLGQNQPVAVSNIADRVKCRSRVDYLSEQSADDGDCEESNAEEERTVDKERRIMKIKRKGRPSRNKHLLINKSKQLSRKGIEGVTSSPPFETDEMENSEQEGEESGGRIVPNIAESVKRRRSCTKFNHEGQYANSGEGTDEENPRQQRTLIQHRERKDFAKSHLVTHSEKEIEEKTQTSLSKERVSVEGMIGKQLDENDEPKLEEARSLSNGISPTCSRGESKVTGSAVVIRRKMNKSCVTFPRRMGPEADWGRFQTNKDWSLNEDETDKEESTRAGESQPFLVASQVKKTEKQNLEEKETVQESGIENVTERGRTNKRRSKHHRKKTRNLIPTDSPKAESQNMTLSPASITNSPRWRLRIRREANSGEYSSSLENIDEDPEVSTKGVCKFKNRQKKGQNVSKLCKAQAHEKTESQDSTPGEHQPPSGSAVPSQSPHRSESVHLRQSSSRTKMEKGQGKLTDTPKKKEEISKNESCELLHSPVTSQISKRSGLKRKRLEYEKICPDIKEFKDVEIHKPSVDSMNESPTKQKPVRLITHASKHKTQVSSSQSEKTKLNDPSVESDQTHIKEEQRPASPSFPSPKAKKARLSTPNKKKKSVPLLKADSPIFKMSKSNVKYKQSPQKNLPLCTDSKKKQQNEFGTECKEALSPEALKAAGLDASVQMDCKKQSTRDSSTKLEANPTIHSKRLLSPSNMSPSPVAKRVKLGNSWRLVSDRSMARLIESEHESSFDGFQESNNDVPSDLTYTDKSEVDLENSEGKEWIIDPKDTNVANDSTLTAGEDEDTERVGGHRELQGSDSELGELLTLVPTFSSPGKATDSSWGDTCESYLSTSIGKHSTPRVNTPEKSPGGKRGKSFPMSPFKLPSECGSPRSKKTPQKMLRKASTSTPKESEGTSSKTLGKESKQSREKHRNRSRERQDKNKLVSVRQEMKTPTKSKPEQDLELSPVIQRVDRVVSFNHMSPQRLNFSPYKNTVPGPSRLNFSPIKTNRPHANSSGKE